MGKNAGHVLIYKNTEIDPEDVRRVQELEQHFQPKSLRNFPANPDVKQLQDRQMGLVDNGTVRYLVLRIGNTLYRVGITRDGDFVQIPGDTMSGQLGSSLAPGTAPFAVTSTTLNVNLNADMVDSFHHDQSLLTTASPVFVSVTLSGLTASRLMATDGAKALVSVAALTSWVAGTTNQITITDDGDGTITISTPQNIHIGASPTFVGVTLSGLTASRLIATSGAKALESVAALTAWMTGTANRITVTDDGDGTVTLSTPQDIHTGASPTFVGMTLSGLTASRLMATEGAKAAESVAALSAWIAGTASQIVVTDDGDGSITLSLASDFDSRNVVTVSSATHTLAAGEDTLHVTYTATGAVTITLATAEATDGREIDIVDAGSNAGTNNITINTEGAETIQGQASFSLIADNEAIGLYAEAGDWFFR